jgi:hypothetical protein
MRIYHGRAGREQIAHLSGEGLKGGRDIHSCILAAVRPAGTATSARTC